MNGYNGSELIRVHQNPARRMFGRVRRVHGDRRGSSGAAFVPSPALPIIEGTRAKKQRGFFAPYWRWACVCVLRERERE